MPIERPRGFKGGAMKKLTIIFCFIFLSFSFVNADSSKNLSFIWNLLDALHSLNWGSSYEVMEGDDITQMLTKFMNQNSKYNVAAKLMKGYIDEKDEFISMVAKGIVKGTLSLVDANDKIISKIRKISNDDPEGFEDVEFTIAETNVQKKEAWEVILLAAGWSMPVIIEFPKNDNPTGKIPFKISEKEKEILIKRINKLFKEKLERYHNFLSLSKQGKETNPADSTYIIAGVDKIKQYLTTETYEQAEMLELQNKHD